jgi:Flp pilus assembly protein TadG
MPSAQSPARSRARPSTAVLESGSAVVDFALVSALVSLLFVAVLQVGFAMHIRNTLIWCASEGARLGARSGSTPADGAARTRELITSSVAPGYAQDITAGVTSVDGVQVVQVSVRAPLPLVAFFGPSGAVDVRGRAFLEDQ